VTLARIGELVELPATAAVWRGARASD